MKNKLPISVCMISGAEAPRIGQALASVAEWAGEIVVVLNEGVADGTEEIAAGFGAKIFREPWRGFVAQKNSAGAKAAQPWLLNLDADEVVSPALAAEIAGVVSARSPSRLVYEFPRRTFYCGRWIGHGDWYPDRVRRLWRKGAARWVGEEPHAALESEGAVGRLDADLLHYANQTINQQLAKTAAYSDCFARHCAAEKRGATFLDLYVRPWWRFLRAYFLRLGFLDGWQGYYIAWATAFYAATRYAKVREAQLAAEGKTAPRGDETTYAARR